MPAEPTIAVVICAYTEVRWERLVDAVTSVIAQTRPAAEIILVIDYNATLSSRAKAEFGSVRVMANVSTRGLSGARNTGTRASKADVVAFLDDDAVASRDWLEHLAHPYAMPCVTGVGGRIDPVWASGRPRWWPPEFDWVVGCTYRGMAETAQDVRNVIGANMSFRRATIVDAGGFDVGTGRGRGRPLGGEETELSIRIAHREPGARIRYEPSARVDHHVPPERATFRYFVERCYAEGISKARVARMTGRVQGLASERRYASRTLPAAVWRDMHEAVRHRDAACVLRAAAVAIGLLVTTVGYVIGGRTSATATRSRMTDVDSDSSAAAGRHNH